MPKIALPPSLKYVSFFVAILLALLAIVGIGVTYVYHDKYYPGVKVGGIDVGGQKQADVAAQFTTLDQAITARKVTVAVPDITQSRDAAGQYPDTLVSTTAADLGLSISSETALNQAWSVGHSSGPWQWVKQVAHLFFIGGDNYVLAPSLDSDKVNGFVATQVVDKAAPPQPAKIVVDGKDVTVQDEVPGLQVDSDGLSAQLTSALLSSLDSDAIAFRVPPTLTDSPIGRSTVQPVADQLNKLGDTKVSLTATSLALKPARTELLQWYTPVLSDSGEVSLGVNSDRISTYLLKNGAGLDQKKSLASISQAVTDWLSNPMTSAVVAVTLKAPTAVTVGSYQAGLFDGKYVFVNLAEQKLYRMNGQTMEKVYRVSTGKWSTPTPHGTFTVASKTPRAYSSEFGLYMPWWQNFLGTSTTGEVLPRGSYGLHELPEWPNGYKEGQAHLGTPVSHGCVRLGVGDAKELYDWTEIGTPVVIQ